MRFAISKGLKKPFSHLKNRNSFCTRIKSSTKVLASITTPPMRIREKSELLPIVFPAKLALNI